MSLRSAAAVPVVCGVAGEFICRFFGLPTFSQEVEHLQERLSLDRSSVSLYVINTYHIHDFSGYFGKVFQRFKLNVIMHMDVKHSICYRTRFLPSFLNAQEE